MIEKICSHDRLNVGAQCGEMGYDFDGLSLKHVYLDTKEKKNQHCLHWYKILEGCEELWVNLGEPAL